jgi:hypothetical protein
MGLDPRRARRWADPIPSGTCGEPVGFSAGAPPPASPLSPRYVSAGKDLQEFPGDPVD